MKKLIFLVLFLAWALPASATVFYFDSSPTGCAGSPCSNANAGTSPATAWLDTSKFVGLTVNGGDQYLFRRGDTFRYPTVDGNIMISVGTYNGSTVGNPLIFGSYGTGAKPIINGSHCEGSGAATVTPPFPGAVAQASPCSGATPVTWTLDTGSIYKLAWAAAYPFNIVVDGPTGDNVPPPNTTSGSGYGLSWAGCKTGTCPQSTVMVPASWASGQAYGPTACISNAVQGLGEWFCRTATTGNSAGSAPQCAVGGTCQAGTTTNVTQNDTGNTWAFEGTSGFAQGAMTAGSAFWDGQFLYVWMPDGSDPSTHSIEVVTQMGFRSVANGSEKNNESILGLHITRVGEGLRIFTTGTGGTNCQGGHTIANNIIDTIGEPNADDSQFLNIIRYSQGNSVTGNCTPRPQIIGNRVDHTGARGITCQTCAGGLIAENEATFCPHSCINLVSVVAGSNNNAIAYHNKVHDIHHSLTNATFPDSAIGIYSESSNNLTIAANTVYDVSDAGCTTDQCDCVQLFANTGTSLINNTCNNAQNGFYLSNGCATATIENNLISNLSGGTPGTTQLPMDLNNTCCAAPGGVDFNVLTNATTVGKYNSAAQTFAQWNADGFDVHGFNSNAIYFNIVYPFQQTTASPGYQTGDRSKGYGKNIGANQANNLTQ